MARLFSEKQINKPMKDIDTSANEIWEDEDACWREVIQDDWELCYLSVCLAEMFHPSRG